MTNSGWMRATAVCSVLALVCVLLVAAGIRRRALDPVADRRGWHPISGNWTVGSNIISNAHCGRGDMLILEQPPRTNYRISADVRFDLLFTETHYGDAGVIIRTTDPQPGVDSYKGYYAGLRPDGQTVVLGRAAYDWELLSEAKLLVPISVSDWYHLELAAHGCNIEVAAQPPGNRPATYIHYQDQHCLTAGVAGLRSFYTDASWRNVRVAPW